MNQPPHSGSSSFPPPDTENSSLPPTDTERSSLPPTNPETNPQNVTPHRDELGFEGQQSNNYQRPAEEFDFYFQFTKPLVLDLHTAEDRAVAAAWVQKLEAEPATQAEKHLRLDYLKLLLFVLQRGRLSGIFTKKPPSGPFQPFPPGFCMLDMGNLMIDQDDPQNCGAGEGGQVPYTIEISNDLREFVAAQEIPNFGVQMYYAWSSEEPVHKWTLFDEEKFPLYVLEKIKLMKEMSSEEKTGTEKTGEGGKKIFDMSMENFSKKKVKSPQEIERSQGRSYHTYVGLSGGMGGFNEKSDQDQDKLLSPDQRRTKYNKTNTSTPRRYPQTHPVFRDADPGMLPPEAYDNFLNFSGSKFYEPRFCYCPTNPIIGDPQQRQGPMYPPAPQQQQPQQQLQPQSCQDQSGARASRGRTRQDGSPPREQMASRQKTSPRRTNYPASQLCPETDSSPQMVSYPQRKSPPRRTSPQTTTSQRTTSQRTNIDITQQETSNKMGKQKVCLCPPSMCNCLCPRASSRGIPMRGAPNTPGQERGPEERIQNRPKTPVQSQRPGTGPGYPPEIIQCFDPMYQDQVKLVNQQMSRQPENWAVPREDLQQISTRQVQQSTIDAKSRSTRTSPNQTQMSPQAVGGRRARDRSAGRQTQQTVEESRYEGGFEVDQASMNAQQMGSMPQWQSPRPTSRFGMNYPQNLEEMANQNRRINYQDQSMGRKKVECRRDLNQSQSRSRDGSPTGYASQNEPGRLANMNNMLEGIKQKTEAHRERCNQAGSRRPVQDDTGFIVNTPYQMYPPHPQCYTQNTFQQQTMGTQQSAGQQYSTAQNVGQRLTSPNRQPQQQSQLQAQSQQQSQLQAQSQQQSQLQAQSQQQSQLQAQSQQSQLQGQSQQSQLQGQRQPLARSPNSARPYPLCHQLGQTQSPQQPDGSFYPYQTLDFSDPGPSISARYPPNMNVAGTQKAPKNVINAVMSSHAQQPCRRGPSPQEPSSTAAQGQGMRVRNVNEYSRGQAAGIYRNIPQRTFQTEQEIGFEELQTQVSSGVDEEYDEERDENYDVYTETYDENALYLQETGYGTTGVGRMQPQQQTNQQSQQQQALGARLNASANMTRNIDQRTKQLLSSTPLNPTGGPHHISCGMSTIPPLSEEEYMYDTATDFYSMQQDFDDLAYSDATFAPVYGVSNCQSNMQDTPQNNIFQTMQTSARPMSADKKRKASPGQ